MLLYSIKLKVLAKIRYNMQAFCTQVFKEDNITIKGIYERSDTKVRALEGLEKVKGFLSEEFETKFEVVCSKNDSKTQFKLTINFHY